MANESMSALENNVVCNEEIAVHSEGAKNSAKLEEEDDVISLPGTG